MIVVSVHKTQNSPTGLPLVKNFPVAAGFPQQLLMVSGSAHTNNPGGALLEVEVLVGAVVVDTLTVYTNEGNSHKAFPTALIALALAPNPINTLTIREKDGTQTTTDQNDYFSASLVLGP